jgi:hypothetical protein
VRNRGQQISTITIAEIPTHNNSQKVKKGPTLQGFGVWAFTITSTHTPTQTNFRKEKKVGPSLQGFRVRDFRITSTQNINTQQLPKCEREKWWDPHFGISGFGTSRLQALNTNTTQTSEIRK